METAATEEELFLEGRHLALRRRVEALGDSLAAADPLARLAADGLIQLALPEAQEVPDLRSLCVVQQALARVSVAAGRAFETQVSGGHLLFLAGSDRQRDDLLVGIRSGDRVAALATGEDGDDVLPATLATARPEGDDYVLDGTKTFVRSAGKAALFTVLARTGEGDSGLTLFLVEPGRPGVGVEDRRLLGDTTVVDLHLEGCRVAASARLGGEGEGLALAERSRIFLAPMLGAAALGLGVRALDEALARLRNLGDSGGRPSVSQGTQHALADMATELEGGRLLVERAAAEQDAGRARPDLSAMAQLFAVETAGRVVDAAVQLDGESGLLEGSVLEGLYRAVRSCRFERGTTASYRDRIARERL